MNAFSFFEFIGIVEFESVQKIENSNGYYESKYKISKVYKGKGKPEIYINSQEGSSCSFIPGRNTKYLILGERINGKIEISFCSAMQVPDKNKLAILDNLVSLDLPNKTSFKLFQTFNEDINPSLFSKSVNGTFIYEVVLNSKLNIEKLSPLNDNAKNSFNEKVRTELLRKIRFKRISEYKKENNSKLTSYIILNWTTNYENEKVFGATRL
ncbi:MAG: hypothetical protein CMB99_02120 [Flavobacteriaceae bacterium]|nr:hypothetical protein [Flavobacteriaceae bacterium]